MLNWDDFEKVDLRVGTILEVREFLQAHRPAYQLLLDFGPEIGLKKSSAQLTRHYTLATLVGRQVLAVVDFPPKHIGPFRSEVLVGGVPDAAGHIVLNALAAPVPKAAAWYENSCLWRVLCRAYGCAGGMALPGLIWFSRCVSESMTAL